MQEQQSFAAGLLKLFASVAALIVVVYLAQIPIEKIPAFKTYSEAADKYDLHPGALYYSDVPITLDAEHRMRRAVRSVDEKHLQERAARN